MAPVTANSKVNDKIERYEDFLVIRWYFTSYTCEIGYVTIDTTQSNLAKWAQKIKSVHLLPVRPFPFTMYTFKFRPVGISKWEFPISDQSGMQPASDNIFERIAVGDVSILKHTHTHTEHMHTNFLF